MAIDDWFSFLEVLADLVPALLTSHPNSLSAFLTRGPHHLDALLEEIFHILGSLLRLLLEIPH